MAGPKPIVLCGRDPARNVTIATPLFLAPMEGITDPTFRDHVMAIGGLGAACTEFIRLSVAPVPSKVVRRNLGPNRATVPVAVQFMAADETHLAATIRNAERAGATWIDLNFGCPAPVVFNKCAGSALLAKPELMARIIATAVAATGLPVSVKMRVGITATIQLGECLRAAAGSGAAMITLHARLRCESYAMPATWAWIAEARRILDQGGHRLPLVGNGSVDAPADVARMHAETGCDGVMIGRAALADPWIFSQVQGGAAPTPALAARFALAYAASVAAGGGAHASLIKLKQLIRYFSAGGIFAGREEERRRLLRLPDLAQLLSWFTALGDAPMAHQEHEPHYAPPVAVGA